MTRDELKDLACLGFSAVKAMEDWIANGELLKGDDADYAAVIDIDLADIKEPIVVCPNDPDDVKLLSDVAGDKIDEVEGTKMRGSCMTNIGHNLATEPRRRQGARRQARHPHASVDRPAHHDGRHDPQFRSKSDRSRRVG